MQSSTVQDTLVYKYNENLLEFIWTSDWGMGPRIYHAKWNNKEIPDKSFKAPIIADLDKNLIAAMNWNYFKHKRKQHTYSALYIFDIARGRQLKIIDMLDGWIEPICFEGDKIVYTKSFQPAGRGFEMVIDFNHAKWEKIG